MSMTKDRIRPVRGRMPDNSLRMNFSGLIYIKSKLSCFSDVAKGKVAGNLDRGKV